MSSITCRTTVDGNTMSLEFPTETIALSLESDIDFTDLVKHLSILVEDGNEIEFERQEGEAENDKQKVALEVTERIIASYNEVIAVDNEAEIAPETPDPIPDDDNLPF